ncbi:MFS transporter [Goodfellowiella coeruleoviolacea]|uniref:Drug resistance transporter, EmrB/QacA subfamily n=1 Tax=Goodfellowiella coeruleoviolacea TaxID=334858 RepID=A0AAE3KEP3_9PSEU|nr:MFS transporter [Goodfellowiella coeruleoviolacea]MCP2164107.1 drug resistance transporter, EmrB/QacA subfamily [Goodfellowiella coeruleoviolacea]
MSERGNGLPTFLITGIASFMASLDNLVVTTALPKIRADFDSSLESLEWTVNAYTLTFAVFLLTAAILGDRFGRRTVFIAGLSLFTLASAGAAVANSVGALIVARTVQGVGGSVIFPLALTLVVRSVSARRRGGAIAGLSAMSGLAIALGPLVGGLIVEYGDWHWIFWINVPIGVVLVPLAALRLRESHGPHSRLDIGGTVLVTAGLLGIVYGLVRSSGLGWANPQVWLAITGGVVLLGGFLAWERRHPFPVLPPHLFRSRGFTLTNLVALVMQGSLFGVVFLLTQFLQNVLDYSPLMAGSRTLPWTLMPLAVAPLAAVFANRVGTRPLLAASAAAQGLALLWFSAVVTTSTSYPALVPPMLLTGLGMGVFFSLIARQALDFVTPEQEGVASGVNNAMRQVGVVVGIGSLSAVFAANGGYATDGSFVEGLDVALWAGAVLFALAAVAVLLTPARPTPHRPAQPAAQPAEPAAPVASARDATS